MKRIAIDTRTSRSKHDLTRQKLQIHRETLRRLHETHLQLAAGGVECTASSQASEFEEDCCP